MSHVVVVNRWRERYAEYDRYLDHGAHRVTYVTTEVGLASVPAAAAATAIVAATDDLDAVRAAVGGLVDRFGPPSAIVALKEDDLLVGAHLREEWDCPGQRTLDLLVFRDKGVMCEAVQRAGLPIPAFAPAPDAGAVLGFAAEHGWPVVVKPRIGSSSAGVVQLDGPADLAEVDFGAGAMLVQAFCGDPIHHVDGVFDGRDVVVWRGSRYLNTCLGFRTGTVLGSVEQDDPELHLAFGEAARRFVGALSRRPLVFHLEVFVGRDGDGRPACTFLEVGARTGGAEIPFVWREVHGYDLVEAATCVQLGRPVPPAPPAARVTGRSPVAGWLLVPAPASRPCRIVESTPMVGRDPGPYAEVVLRPGQVLPAADSYYEHVGGRFRFQGSTSAEVERAIAATARHYRVVGEPVLVAAAAHDPRRLTAPAVPA